MSNVVASIIATFVTIPIFTWFLLYFITRYITKNNKRSFQMATDYSTFFFHFSCSLFNRYYLGPISSLAYINCTYHHCDCHRSSSLSN